MVNCLKCNTSFILIRNDPRIKYCSKKCREYHWVAVHKTEDKALKKRYRDKKQVLCRQCGCNVPSERRGSGVVFCSDVCLSKRTKINAKKYRHNRLQILAEYKLQRGCSICGYKKCASALDFHHVNPEEKDKRVLDIEKDAEEIKKCILVCKNCHFEIHEKARKGTKRRVRMKKENRKTLICFLLDRSGSMSGKEADVIGGVNTTLKNQRECKDPCEVIFVRFDTTGIERFRERMDIQNVYDLTPSEFKPNGGTPLYDAMGRTIQALDADIAAYNPAKIIMVIITDGEENSSHEYTHAKLKEMIQSREGRGWAFLFLGANFDACKAAQNIGIMNYNNYFTYQDTHYGRGQMYCSLSSNLTHMRMNMTSSAECWEKKDGLVQSGS